MKLQAATVLLVLFLGQTHVSCRNEMHRKKKVQSNFDTVNAEVVYPGGFSEVFTAFFYASINRSHPEK